MSSLDSSYFKLWQHLCPTFPTIQMVLSALLLLLNLHAWKHLSIKLHIQVQADNADDVTMTSSVPWTQWSSSFRHRWKLNSSHVILSVGYPRCHSSIRYDTKENQMWRGGCWECFWEFLALSDPKPPPSCSASTLTALRMTVWSILA